MTILEYIRTHSVEDIVRDTFNGIGKTDDLSMSLTDMFLGDFISPRRVLFCSTECELYWEKDVLCKDLDFKCLNRSECVYYDVLKDEIKDEIENALKTEIEG